MDTKPRALRSQRSRSSRACPSSTTVRKWKVRSSSACSKRRRSTGTGRAPSLASRAPHLNATSPVVVFVYVEDVDGVFGQALEAGLAVESVVVDPGVDFTKTPAQSVELTERSASLIATSMPRGTCSLTFETAGSWRSKEAPAAVGAVDEIAIPEESAVVDGRGRFLMPGLVDMHVHALWDPSVPPVFFPLFVANGVTTVRDMGGLLDLLPVTRAALADGGRAVTLEFIPNEDRISPPDAA